MIKKKISQKKEPEAKETKGQKDKVTEDQLGRVNIFLMEFHKKQKKYEKVKIM